MGHRRARDRPDPHRRGGIASITRQGPIGTMGGRDRGLRCLAWEPRHVTTGTVTDSKGSDTRAEGGSGPSKARQVTHGTQGMARCDLLRMKGRSRASPPLPRMLCPRSIARTHSLICSSSAISPRDHVRTATVHHEKGCAPGRSRLSSPEDVASAGKRYPRPVDFSRTDAPEGVSPHD
jgi:hypothetical protein